VSVVESEAVKAVNVLNGFAGPMLALTAHSSIWRGAVDPECKDVAEKFWDWWEPAAGRVGVPEHRFRDLQHYLDTITAFPPVYVKREGAPVLLNRYGSFAEYAGDGDAKGTDLKGNEVALQPAPEDLELHNSCYWFNARISRYYTVENRICDQQPPGELLVPAALTLGLVTALDEADRFLSEHPWDFWRAARPAACNRALGGDVDGVSLAGLASSMVEIARAGLERRGLGEERFLDPLDRRLNTKWCPADEAEAVFAQGGISALVEKRKL
jgi:gamma-glutamylcysteine synthetase